MKGYCQYHKIRYETEACQKCALETWRSQRNGGCLFIFFLWPFALLGIFAGSIFGTFWSAFKAASTTWEDSWQYTRAEKPGRREES